MSFSTVIFLFVFLPCILLGYYIVNDRLKKVFLLFASLAFYAYGSSETVPILLISILINYIYAIVIEKNVSKKVISKIVVVTMLITNVGLLCVYKYFSYAVTFFYGILGVEVKSPNLSLPLGISFFTFSAISYVLDVYFKTTKAEKSILNVAVYISFFPKLISGPIISWSSFENELKHTRYSLELFVEGIKKFIIGLSKKVIIADVIAVAADNVYNAENVNNFAVLTVWLGAFYYIIQLYFDFSGYSDMAVGLGKMLGFNLNENFNYPLVSKSVSEFWDRWHMSLGAWIEHYIYTPLMWNLSQKKWKNGKSLDVKKCDYIALLITWIVMGVWHGVGVKYLVWGLLNCAFISNERLWLNYRKKRKKQKRPVKDNVFTTVILPHIYFFVFVEISYIIFRANNLTSAGDLLLSMFGLTGNTFINYQTTYMIWQYRVLIPFALFAAFPVVKRCKEILAQYVMGLRICKMIEVIAYPILFLVAISYTANSSYNSFIYFNF